MKGGADRVTPAQPGRCTLNKDLGPDAIAWCWGTISIIYNNPLSKCIFHHLSSILYMRIQNRLLSDLARTETQRELIHISRLQVQSQPYETNNIRDAM
jgi:hypothetical protein